MRIGIIGAGNVGGALGTGWAKKGHEIRFGVRDANDPRLGSLVAEIGPNAGAATVRDAASFGPVVVLATPWGAVPDAILEAGDLSDRFVLDCTNPLAGVTGLAIGHDTSAAEQLAALAPTAHVVKVFNTTGANNMADPKYPDGPATMFYCGDDADAKAAAAELAQDLGFEAVDAGPLTQARLLEPLALLWITLAHAQGLGRDIAFRLMRR